MYLMQNFYIFVTALFMSLVMVPSIRKWAFDTGAVDYPGDRRVNSRVVPRVGGVAIFIPFLFSVLVYSEMNREVRGILAGSLIIFFTGLIDDLYDLSPRQKFVGQTGGCLVAVLVGHLYLTDLGDIFGLGPVLLPIWAGGMLALFALVGVVNAVNLIDGLDGLAGGVSVISLLAFFWLAFQDSNFSVLALCAGLLGGLLGFLKYNAFPARIFMGDTGSLVVGFVLATIAIDLTQGPQGNVKAVVPLLVLAVPITDTIVVMLNRILKGCSPLIADKTHLHHKIMSLGLGHAPTVLLICSLSLVWALTAMAFRNGPDHYLFGGLLLGTLVLHLALNALLKHRASLQEVGSRLLARLHLASLHRLSARLDSSVSLLMVFCLALYGLAAVWVGDGFPSRNTALLGMVVVFGSCGLLFYRTCHKALFYPLLLAPVLLINYQVENLGGEIFWQGLTYAQLTNGLSVLLSLLLAVKFVLLRSLDRVLDFALDFILFAMGLTLAVVSPEFDLTYHLSGILSKGIVIFLALRFLVIEDRRKMLLASVWLNLTLLVILLKGGAV